MFKALHFR